MGAQVQVVDLNDIQQLPPLLEAEAERLQKTGRHPFIIDPFRPDVLARSALGYVKRCSKWKCSLKFLLQIKFLGKLIVSLLNMQLTMKILDQYHI